MQQSPEDFDSSLRDHAPETQSLPSDFRDRVWRTIRTQEQEAALAGWFESTFLTSISPLRLATSFGVTAILLSTLLGIWLGNASQSKPRGEFFSSLTATGDLSLLDP